MSSTPSHKSNDTSFPDPNIPRSSEYTDMQTVPEITIHNPAGDEIPSDSPAPFVRRQIPLFLQPKTIERTEDPDLVETQSVRVTDTTVTSTDSSTLPSSSQQRQRPRSNALHFSGEEFGISPDGTLDLRLPTLDEQVRAVVFPEMDIRSPDRAMGTHLPRTAEEVRTISTAGLDISSRVREFQRARRLRHLDQSRRQHITRRHRRARRHAMDVVPGRPVSSILTRPSSNTSRPMTHRGSTNNVDVDDEAVNMDPPLPDPAMNLDTFTARRNIRSRSALSNVMSTSDLEDVDEDEEYKNRGNTGLSCDFVTLPERLQARGYGKPTVQRRSARRTFTTPVNSESPDVVSTSPSTSISRLSTTKEQQNKSQATGTGTGNTTVSSRKLSQNATVRLWVAMYRTNDMKQQDLERMRAEGVDDIPISKLSITGPSRK
ncbi:hypothetical protein BPOR_1066g00010 [Botrytis porri]|uniref:Uncharacterized protein n=1 Tax=Botrytis porri TaxID=87229 RepID=A0A4Z1KDP1_9HELO|nr:hypothetical protein BPOR_1066g00010 [Botrytis porri]